jgi:hypothetical protein
MRALIGSMSFVGSSLLCAGHSTRTRHARTFGGARPYLMDAEEVLPEIATFVAGRRRAAT